MSSNGSKAKNKSLSNEQEKSNVVSKERYLSVPALFLNDFEKRWGIQHNEIVFYSFIFMITLIFYDDI